MALDIDQILLQARTLTESGKDEDARMLLLELLKEEPNNKAALLMLGGAYFSLEKFQEAEMVFDRLVTMEPGTGKFSVALFNALWKMGREEDGLREVHRFLTTADKAEERETIEQYVAITSKIVNQVKTSPDSTSPS
ncbi:tetratricopeptide repeat protein [Pseudomonadota bacterium]